MATQSRKFEIKETAPCENNKVSPKSKIYGIQFGLLGEGAIIIFKIICLFRSQGDGSVL